MPLTQFAHHDKGRCNAGHHYANCRNCTQVARNRWNVKREQRKATFNVNMANGSIAYDGAFPPHQFSQCYYFSDPPVADSNSPCPSVWFKTCDWRGDNQSRELELNQVKICCRCRSIKPRAEFMARAFAGFQVRTSCAKCRPMLVACCRNHRSRSRNICFKVHLEVPWLISVRLEKCPS